MSRSYCPSCPAYPVISFTDGEVTGVEVVHGQECGWRREPLPTDEWRDQRTSIDAGRLQNVRLYRWGTLTAERKQAQRRSRQGPDRPWQE